METGLGIRDKMALRSTFCWLAARYPNWEGALRYVWGITTSDAIIAAISDSVGSGCFGKLCSRAFTGSYKLN